VIELLQNCLAAMESVNSLVMPDYMSDANSIAEINSPMLNIDARLYERCKELGFHDARKCPKKHRSVHDWLVSKIMVCVVLCLCLLL
jgi:hypothetical protein